MIAIRNMTLHNPLFLSGTNLGQRIDEKSKSGGEIKMYFQPEFDRYVVTYKGKGKFIHTNNVADAEPVNMKDLGLEEPLVEAPAQPSKTKTKSHPQVANIAHAQVADPTRGSFK